MGLRLHYAKKYEVEWEGGFFNWMVEPMNNFLSKYNVWIPEDYSTDMFIERDTVKKIVSDMQCKPVDEKVIVDDEFRHCAYTADDVRRFFQSALDNTPESYSEIHFSWY